MTGKKIKVLHLVAGDITGGAARGAYWLHKGLRALDIESRILTTSQETYNDSNIISIALTPFGRFLKSFRRYLDLIFAFIHIRRRNVIFSTGLVGPNLLKMEEFRQADIIHLHWINNGFFNIKYLPRIDKPVVWTVRDMWPMTGGCHMADYFDCDRYKEQCGTCRQLRSASNFDLSRFIWKQKRKYYQDDIKIVGISNWIADKAKESSLLGNCDVRCISNNVDVNFFRPVDRQEARKKLGIDTEKKVILAGAAFLDVPWKGFREFQQALEGLNRNQYYLCLFGKYFGRDRGHLYDALGIENRKFGFITDDKMMRLLYSAADVYVSPSIIEPFGKTIAEAMACGTPVVCFDATGPKDIVDHKVNGFKAVACEPEDLAKGINWVANAADHTELSSAAREKVTREFDIRVIAEKYLQLYEEIV